jgi:hypothetical protein
VKNDNEDGINWSKYETPDTGIDWSKYESVNSSNFAEKVGVEAPPLDFRKSTIMQQAAKTIVPKEEPKPSLLDDFKSIIGRPKQVAQEALDIVGRPSEIIAEYATPDAPLIGGPQDGMNARQAFLERTGQRPAEGFAEKALGSIAAPFVVPGAGLGTARGLYEAAGPIASKLTSRISSPLAQNVVREGLREAAVGGAVGVGQEFAQGSGEVKDALITGALGGAIGAATGAVGPLVKGGLQSGVDTLRKTIANTEEAQASAIRSVGRESLPSSVKRIGKQEPVQAVTPEPTNLDELIKSRGYPDATPENIAQTYNTKNWYHGTGTDKLTKDSLDPFVGSHESLFGQGVYLTDNPTIAAGYAKNRGKRGVPTVYESNVNVNRVLDLEKPITPDVSEAIQKVVNNLDYHDDGRISGLIRQEITKPDATPESIIQLLRDEVSALSKREMIPSSEFVENFQDLAINLKRAGYDGITHTGGLRTGKDPHRVLIMLDPQNVHGETVGPKQVTRLDKYTPPEPVAAKKPATQKVKMPTRDEVAAASEPVNAESMKQNWFTNLFGNQGIGISPFGSNKRISKDPLTTEQQIVRNPLKNDARGVVNQTAAVARATYQNFVDQLDPLKFISPQAYEKAIDATRANNIANVIVDDKFVSPEGVVIGEGLGNTFRKVGRGQMDKFLDYIVLRHAVTRMSRGERVYADSLNMTPEKVQSRIDMYNKQYPEFDSIAKEWDQFNDNMLRTYGVDEGLMSEEMYTMLREKNPNYAPMRRQFSTSEKFANPLSMGAKPSFSGQKAPIKEVSKTGSVRRVVDPRRSAIEATGAWVNAALRNRVMKSLVDAVKNDIDGMKDIIEIVQRPKGQPNLKDLLEDEGMDGFIESLDSDFNQLFKRTNLDGDNIVRAMIKGEPVYMKVKNPEAVKALIGMGSEQSNLIMDIFGGFSKATKYGATGALAPMFAVKSLSMDVAQSLIQSKNPGTHLWDLGHAIVSSLANTLPKNTPGFNAIRALAQDYKRSGGEYSAALRGDRPLNKSVRKMDRNPILSPKGLAVNAGQLIASPFKALNKVADISENVNRMAAAKGEMRRLGDMRTPDNVTKAMSAAREITTNYSRKGNQSQQIEKFVPYNNAAVQGMYRFVTAWKKNPIKTAALVGGAVMMPKAYEYLMFHEDSDYQALPAREKYRNLIVKKNDDGTFIKVPMPPEYNALGAFMVDSLEALRDNNPVAFKGASDAMTNAFTPPLASGLAQGITQGGGIEQSIKGGFQSTVLGPPVSVASNQSFTGAPIESMAVADRSPQFRYDERTSAVAKWIGKNLGYSPMKTDYLLRSYGGDPARLILPLTSQVGQGSTRNTLLRNFIVDPTFTNNLTNDYYAGKEKLTQAYRDNQEVGQPLPEWFSEELRKMVTSTAKSSYSSQLSNLTKQKKEINLDDSLTLKEKSTKVKEIQRQMNEIYLELNSKMTEAGVPIPNR